MVDCLRSIYYQFWAMKLSWLEEPPITTENVSGFEFVWLKQTNTWCRCTIKVTILSTKVQKTHPGSGGGHPIPQLLPLGALRLVTCAYNDFTPSYAPVCWTDLCIKHEENITHNNIDYKCLCVYLFVCLSACSRNMMLNKRVSDMTLVSFVL